MTKRQMIDLMTISDPLIPSAARFGVGSCDDPTGYRELMSCFPTGVAVVTAVDAAGRAQGMTCTSLTSVTLDPPTLLVCLGSGRSTTAAVHAGGRFAVNLLRADAAGVARLFSSPTPDRFSHVHWEPSPALSAPWLCDDAFALAECSVSRTIAVADHDLVLGQVVWSCLDRPAPLLYGQRRFASFPTNEP